MPLQVFAKTLVENIPAIQICKLLEAVSAKITDGTCPICEMKVVRAGKEMFDMHDKTCIVRLIEEAGE